MGGCAMAFKPVFSVHSKHHFDQGVLGQATVVQVGQMEIVGRLVLQVQVIPILLVVKVLLLILLPDHQAAPVVLVVNPSLDMLKL